MIFIPNNTLYVLCFIAQSTRHQPSQCRHFSSVVVDVFSFGIVWDPFFWWITTHTHTHNSGTLRTKEEEKLRKYRLSEKLNKKKC